MSIAQYDEMMRRLVVEGEAYRVGGSVRDELMGVEPVDPDYVVRLVSIERLHDLLGPECTEIMVGRVQVGWRLRGIDVMLPRVEESSGLTRHAFEVRCEPGLSLQADPAIGALEDRMMRRVPEDHYLNPKVDVHVPDLGLLMMNEIELLEDGCTNALQGKLEDGWRILAVCPQPDQRRPDYVLCRGGKGVD